MKISLDLKNKKDEIIEDLKKFNFNINVSSTQSIWVNNLKYIFYEEGSIQLVKNDVNIYINTYNIKLEDIKYFEVHKEI